MDFAPFNGRKAAEDGIFLPLRHPFTRELMGEGDDAPGFLIRGAAAKSVQERLAEMQKKPEETGDEKAFAETMHASLIDSAMRFIIEPRNIEIEGKTVKTEAQIREILDMSFPEIEAVTDANGNAVTVTVQDDEGKDIKVPKLEVTNLPFAKQVVDAAQDGARFLGVTSST